MATIFITVGTYGFETLVDACTTDSFLNSINEFGYTKVLIQYGSSEAIFTRNIASTTSTIEVEGYAYKPSITQDMKDASLVISHAGAGNILQALRIPRPLIVVNNTLLMGDHQQELAQVMQEKNYCLYSTISGLLEAIDRLRSKKLDRLPPPSTSVFADLLNTHMGFT
ncbi:glycosyl transferase [Fennellomyces sp. T-0311]|nr:glycosyl transferase [Fennellomyces sp. T-0311]